MEDRIRQESFRQFGRISVLLQVLRPFSMVIQPTKPGT